MLLAKQDGNVAEWLRRGLQILVSRFDSGRCLQKKNLVLVLKKSKLNFLHSSVAQLVEQLTVNQLVAGSSPARGAKYYPTLEMLILMNPLTKISIIHF